VWKEKDLHIRLIRTDFFCMMKLSVVWMEL